MEAAGEPKAARELRSLRRRLGITTRQVEEFARLIAEDRQNEEFSISNAWLTQLENYTSIPSIYKLYTLSVIYRRPLSELLSLFGVDIRNESRLELKPHRDGDSALQPKAESAATPARTADQSSAPESTDLLANIIRLWGHVPWRLLPILDLRHGQYAFIGTKDYTMFPIIKPGTVVEIDSRFVTPKVAEWHNDLDRPIYFIELRGRYVCSWCDLRGSELTIVPHPLSRCPVEGFAYPFEAEVLGQVVSVVMRLGSLGNPLQAFGSNGDGQALDSPRVPG